MRGSQEKKGSKPDMQGTEGGRFETLVPFPHTLSFQNVKFRGGTLA